MSAAWLEDLLPKAMVSPRTHVWWLLFFTLFPLAYVGGVMLELGEEGPARITGASDRAASIRAAREFAASQGVSVSGWSQYAIVETHDDLLAYYAKGNQPDLAAASTLAPAREIQVLFRSPDHNSEFRVYLSLTGQITGYNFGKSSVGKHGFSKVGAFQVHSGIQSDSGKAPDREAEKAIKQDAEAAARKLLAKNAALSNLVTLGKPVVGTNSDDPRQSDIAWDASPPGRKELTLHVEVSVRDSQVVAQHITAILDKDYAKSNLPRSPKLPIFLNSMYGFFLTFGTVYAMYRYAKRTLQKEVSHLRTLVVAGLFAVSYCGFFYSVTVDQVATRVSGQTLSQITFWSYLVSAIVFSIMGLLVGIAYGSGEGEVREAFPGKLTSLDALLAGRVFSRDVAASVMFGAAAAGWLLLIQQALSRFFPPDIAGTRNDVLHYTFARLPWLTLLVGKQYDSLLIAVAGLLLPASFLLRRGVRRKRRFTWLIVFALLAVFRDAAGYSSAGLSFLAMAVFVSALLLPFFAFDLLAAMVSLSALAYASELARLAAVFPSWTDFAIRLAILAAATLALAGYLVVRGNRVREEDVRPQYARNLAERMSMQAEILAAREAQLRLLPQSAPEIPGVQLAACCLPARGVGGDFYDFFPLDAHRLGIFMAQGGDEGLASALCIALTKGVLMHASQQPLSPAQIVIELESSIAQLLESGISNRISFAYAVLDTRRSLLNYARLGSSPQLLVYREGAGISSSAHLERMVATPERTKGARQIFEGAAHLQPGDDLIFFTEGVTSLRTRRFGKRPYQWVEVLMRGLAQKDSPLQASLVSTLSKYQNQASDDLTAVILRIVESKAVLQEVVA